jgi:hypothetical protein
MIGRVRVIKRAILRWSAPTCAASLLALKGHHVEH